MKIMHIKGPMVPSGESIAERLMEFVYGPEIKDLAHYPRRSGKGL